jgi:hypothetical protein
LHLGKTPPNAVLAEITPIIYNWPTISSHVTGEKAKLLLIWK